MNKDGVGSELIIDNIHLASEIATSIKTHNYSNGAIFPNPAFDNITCSFIATAKGDIDIRVYDFTGKVVVYIQRGNIIPGKCRETVDISNLQ